MGRIDCAINYAQGVRLFQMYAIHDTKVNSINTRHAEVFSPFPFDCTNNTLDKLSALIHGTLCNTSFIPTQNLKNIFLRKINSSQQPVQGTRA